MCLSVRADTGGVTLAGRTPCVSQCVLTLEMSPLPGVHHVSLSAR